MIIGVTGPVCSGTNTFCDFLVEKGFVFYSYSDILREELRKKGKEITRKNLQDMGDELRKKMGNGAISKIIISKMRKGENYTLCNLRNLGEVEEFRKLGNFVLVYIDAPEEERFWRMRKRNRENDPKTFSEFKEMMAREFGRGEEESGLQHLKVFKMADYKIDNDGTLEDFRRKTEEFLEKIDIR